MDGQGNSHNYQKTAAREFRYDHPRARYMSRSIDVSASSRQPFDPGLWTPIAPAAWTDYDGAMPYGDFDLDVDASGNGVITEKARYAGGFGTFGRKLLDAQGQATETRYLLGDLIRSTNLTTDGAGAGAQTVAYTAFGEIVGDDGQGGTWIGADPPAGFPRYQYAGGWGYEADLLTLAGAPTSPLPPVRLLHVGARWYEPSIGRFLQRDCIGLLGGLNVYAYTDNDPGSATDPNGTFSWVDYPFKALLAVLRKRALDMAGGPKAMGPTFGMCMPVFRSVEAAPDIARVHVGVELRRRILLEGEGDINERVDRWDRIRNQIVWEDFQGMAREVGVGTVCGHCFRWCVGRWCSRGC